MTDNIGINKMMKNLRTLNPKGEFDVDCSIFPNIIIGTLSASKLSLPVGYYWNEKNGITNKHKTSSGSYESFVYKHDPSHFASNRLKVQVISGKKSIWARLFG